MRGRQKHFLLFQKTRVRFPAPMSGSSLSVTPAPEDLMSLVSAGTCIPCVYTHRLIKKKSFKEKMIYQISTPALNSNFKNWILSTLPPPLPRGLKVTVVTKERIGTVSNEAPRAGRWARPSHSLSRDRRLRVVSQRLAGLVR